MSDVIAWLLQGPIDVLGALFGSTGMVLQGCYDTFIQLGPRARVFWGTIGLAVISYTAYKINRWINAIRSHE